MLVKIKTVKNVLFEVEAESDSNIGKLKEAVRDNDHFVYNKPAGPGFS